MSVHPRFYCPHFHAVHRNLNKVMLKENGGKLILQQSLYATGHQGISWSIFLMVQDIILALRWLFAWYSVISSGDYEGDISLSLN